MARNLRKFSSEAEYTAATLNYPSVAWVTGDDTIHYDKTQPQPVVTEKVVLTFTTPDGEVGNMVFYNGEGSDAGLITGLTFNGEPIVPIVSEMSNVSFPEGVNTIEYAIEGTTIGDAFAGDLTETTASSLPAIEFLIPSFITDVNHLPNNQIGNLVIMATTPPNAEIDFSAFNTGTIYVPDDYVRDYQNSVWSKSGSITIEALSAYQGNLPVVVDNGDESE